MAHIRHAEDAKESRAAGGESRYAMLADEERTGKDFSMSSQDDDEHDIDIKDPIKFEMRDRQKDSVREKIEMRLTYAIITIVLVPIIVVAVFPEKASAIKGALSIITPIVGIYGTIIGFYFGDKK
jgi:hypothetical protein